MCTLLRASYFCQCRRVAFARIALKIHALLEIRPFFLNGEIAGFYLNWRCHILLYLIYCNTCCIIYLLIMKIYRMYCLVQLISHLNIGIPQYKTPADCGYLILEYIWQTFHVMPQKMLMVEKHINVIETCMYFFFRNCNR